MRRLISALLAVVLLVSVYVPVNASQPVRWEVAMEASLDWIYSNVVPHPVVGSVGGEWAVFTLARAGRVTANDPWVRGWLSDLERVLTDVDRITAQGHNIQRPPSAGTFPGGMRRWTDFQRTTIALSSLGLDASDFNGRDLTAIYRTFVPVSQRHSLNMTINVDTFALIAMDTRPYAGNRDQFIEWLVDQQNPSGTWDLGQFELDVTAMALQALAPYYYRGDQRVTEAVHLALRWLRQQSFPDPESTAQMIVALTALGSDYADEAYYYVNRLLRWFDPAVGAFRRPTPNDPINMMATEQAAYGLVAYWRFVNGMTSIYDMSDAFEGGRVELPAIEAAEASARRINVIFPGRTFQDIQGHASRSAIEALATRGIIHGRNETHFHPNATITQAEFATALATSLGVTLEHAVSPNALLSRQDAAVMMADAASYFGIDTFMSNVEVMNILAMFGDSRSVVPDARMAVAFCFREGIWDDEEFYIQPSLFVRRSEAAVMIYRLLNLAQLL